MGNLTKNTEADSELELALSGIHSSDFIFSYSKEKKIDSEKIETKIYVLPVENQDSIIMGFFNINGECFKAPILFSYQTGFFDEKNCIDLVGNFKENINPSRQLDISSCIKIPLNILPIYQEFIDLKTNLQLEGSPFNIVGIKKEYTLPLMLISETSNGEEMRGICFYKNRPTIYPIDLKDETKIFFSNFVKQIKLGDKKRFVLKQYNFSKSLNQQKQPTEGKNSGIEILATDEIVWNEPKSIVRYLDRHIIGQNDAKKIVAVSFSNYMAKVNSEDESLSKENMLLIGGTGTGKTLMISLLAKKALLPMVQTKLVSKSSEGYKGQNLSTVFSNIRKNSDNDSPYGIVFFDEIDKTSPLQDINGSFGNKTQDELIGWLEEAEIICNADDRKVGADGNIAHGQNLNTKNILFITAGAFSGFGDSSLEKIIQKRITREGIDMAGEKNYLKKITPEDIINYGIKPELIGRIPAIAVFDELTTEDKAEILKRVERSPFVQYTKLLNAKGYNLQVDDEVNLVVAKRCPAETGARALNAICNDLFTDIMFEPEKYADEQRIIHLTPDLASKLINLYSEITAKKTEHKIGF